MNYKELSEKIAEGFGYKIVENYQFDDDETDAEIDFDVKEIRFKDEMRNDGWGLLLCLHELGHHILDQTEKREEKNNELTAWEIGLYYAREVPELQGNYFSIEDIFSIFMEGLFVGKGWGEGKTKPLFDD